MFVLEAKFTSHGALALAGTLCLITGLLTLVDGPIPEQRVHLSTAIAAGLGFGSISFLLAWIALRARRSKVLTGPEAMIGAAAIVQRHFEDHAEPGFQVEIRGELWKARCFSPGAPLPVPGSVVQVRAVDGLVLLVDSETPSGTS
jgi:membrane-bound serine protease (ClpP class)